MFKGQGSAHSTTLAAIAVLLASTPADAASRDQLLERFRAQCISQYSHLRGKEQPDVITARVSSCIGNNFKTHLRQAAAAPVSPRHELKVTEFTPWLAGVFVAPAHRRDGIGSALVRYVVREAVKHGYSTVYLFTPSAQDFFSRLGWSIVEHTRYRDTDVTIMSNTIPPSR